MVVGAFPAAKLGALLLKQISKPLAKRIQEQAKSSPIFRKYVCMPPAQFYNWCEIKTKMWVLNLGKPVNIPVLNEAMAIELGANLLGEAIIFAIAAGILISEYARSSRKEAVKEQEKVNEMQRLQNTILELYVQSEQQAAQLKELSRYVYELDSRVVKKPWKQEPKNDGEPPSSAPPPPIAILPIVPIMDGGPAPNEDTTLFAATSSTDWRDTNDRYSDIKTKMDNFSGDSYNKIHKESNLIRKALTELERQFFWGNDDHVDERKKRKPDVIRQPGLINRALNQLPLL